MAINDMKGTVTTTGMMNEKPVAKAPDMSGIKMPTVDKSKQVVPGTGEGGLFLGEDELSSNLAPLEPLDEFTSQKDFETHMLYGLFFGF